MLCSISNFLEWSWNKICSNGENINETLDHMEFQKKTLHSFSIADIDNTHSHRKKKSNWALFWLPYISLILVNNIIGKLISNSNNK